MLVFTLISLLYGVYHSRSKLVHPKISWNGQFEVSGRQYQNSTAIIRPVFELLALFVSKLVLCRTIFTQFYHILKLSLFISKWWKMMSKASSFHITIEYFYPALEMASLSGNEQPKLQYVRLTIKIRLKVTTQTRLSLAFHEVR